MRHKKDFKFRAFSNGKMEYCYDPMGFSFWKWVSYDSDTVVMQFTGLFDKNGKDIFEGDIVRSSECLNEDLGEYQIVWNDGRFRCDTLGGQHWHCGLDKDEVTALNLAVIGNVHENADLLR